MLNEIKGENKERDLKICLDYISGKSVPEIIVERKLDLSVRRVEQIIYKNAEFVNPRVAWPKSKRIHVLQRLVDKYKDQPLVKKDVINILEQLRKEVEGEKPLIEQHSHVTYVWKGDRDRLRSPGVSEGELQSSG